MAHCGQHILEMQLFHELKQRFPNIPDRIVSHYIKQTQGNKKDCTCILEAENWLRLSRMAGGWRSAFGAGEGSTAPPPSQLVDRLSEMMVHHPPSLQPDSTQQLIEKQLIRKQKLEFELQKETERLQKLREVVGAMENDLRSRNRTVADELRQQIRSLRSECYKLTNQVDLLDLDSSIPLGETDAQFYDSIYPGQPFERKTAHKPSRHKHPGRKKEDHWYCHLCTFRNHPLLNKCEECEMPRIDQDCCVSPNIRIHVTHHNYPSCKVIHSWVL